MEKEQKLAVTLTCYLLMFPAITSTINNIFLALFGVTTIIDNLIMYGVLLVLFVRAAMNFKLALNIKQFAVVVIFLGAFFYTMAFYTNNLKYYFWTSFDDVLNPAYVFVFLTFSCFFVSLQLKDADIFLKEAEKWSIAVVVLSFLQYVITHINKLDDPQYMTFSYNMLLSVTLLFLLAFRESKTYRWILAFLGFALIFVAGCRGALVSLIACIFIYLLFFSGFSTNKRTYIFIIGIIVIPVVYFQMNTILSFFARILNVLQIESRTIEMALEESFTYDSGRGNIIEIILKETTLLGKGLFGDRNVEDAAYAHNLFVEWIYDFGFLFGLPLCIGFVFVVIKCLRKADYKWKLFLCALLSVGVFKLMFSGSFLLHEPGLYVLIGICLNEKILNNVEIKSSMYIKDKSRYVKKIN